jgi:hypothetical protein
MTLLAIFDVKRSVGDSPSTTELSGNYSVSASRVPPYFTASRRYGVHRRIYRKGSVRRVGRKPVDILAIGKEDRIRSAGNGVRPMIRDGIVVLLAAEMIPLPLEQA